MNVQYITNNSGDTTAVIIPIDEWNVLKSKYQDIAKQEADSLEIPEWQIALGKEELRNLSTDHHNPLGWEESKKGFDS